MTFFSYKLVLLFMVKWQTSLCASETSSISSSKSENSNLFQVGVILDLDTIVGRVGLTSLKMAHSDFYSRNPNYTTRLVLHVRNSNENTIDAASAALDLLNNVEVDAIIGPQKSAQANFMVDIGHKAHIPIISFSATSPSLHHKTPYFVQTTQNDETQVGAIAAIIKAFMWKQIVLVYEDTSYGNDIVSYLANAFHEIDARIPYRSVFPLSSSDEFVTIELYKLMSMQTRVFVVHMSNFLASRFFLKAKELGMMSQGYVWIITDGLMDLLYNFDSHVIEAMQGVLGVKPRISPSKELESFTFRWKREFHRYNPNTKNAEMSMLALWAYDTFWALATAAEKVKHREPIMKDNTRNALDFGTSKTGPKLLKAINETSFKGLVGEFLLDQGQLRPSVFQIMNVVGKEEQEVGVWTQSRGISSDFISNSNKSFPKIVWPGESGLTPRGWEVPVSGKKLRIGIPVKNGFTEIVRVEGGPLTNAHQVKGLCIEIFESVIRALPYAVPYEYVPFPISDGAGTYNGLIDQVLLQKLDAAVGDITITKNRSIKVDFTLPYTEGGVNMIVPVTYENSGSIWTFFKPLTKELWLASIAFFIITGFAIWILEHRVNVEFRGPPSQHVPMILWFPFSTLVFAHIGFHGSDVFAGEKIVSNLGKLVVVVWIFVVMILASSYTASLSSRLTVQGLKPVIPDVNELIKQRKNVGYQSGSFIKDILKEMGFEEKNLKAYETRYICDEDLSKGSEKGGISAFFDVVAYNNIFMCTFCGKYTATAPIYRTNGFGFAFAKGSPLVGDISRRLIAFAEGDKILDIQRRSFGNRTCVVPDKDLNSLTLKSFLGLFSITGCVTGLCLIIYLVKYVYKNRHFLANSTSTWSRFQLFFKHFDQRDLSSYPFSRRRDDQEIVSDAEVGRSSHFGYSSSRNLHSISPKVSLAEMTVEEPKSEGMVVLDLPK